MKRFSLGVAALIGAVLMATPQVMAAGRIADALVCPPGDFALCAASTCTPTGGTIAVNGGLQPFDEAMCTCPIFHGFALADKEGGNMQGNCDPPTEVNGQSTKLGIWSLYWPIERIPQAINNWNRGPKQTVAPIQECETGNFVNCFSFACVRAGKIHGVEVATCYCPINENLEGQPQFAPFSTPAG